MGSGSRNRSRCIPNGFPPEVIEPFEAAIGRGILGNVPASGTEIIAELGVDHLATGRPIVYTSGDSVFQIAAHVDIVPLSQLYGWCEIARALLIGRHRGRARDRAAVRRPAGRLRASTGTSRLQRAAAGPDGPGSTHRRGSPRVSGSARSRTSSTIEVSATRVYCRRRTATASTGRCRRFGRPGTTSSSRTWSTSTRSSGTATTRWATRRDRGVRPTAAGGDRRAGGRHPPDHRRSRLRPDDAADGSLPRANAAAGRRVPGWSARSRHPCNVRRSGRDGRAACWASTSSDLVGESFPRAAIGFGA